MVAVAIVWSDRVQGAVANPFGTQTSAGAPLAKLKALQASCAESGRFVVPPPGGYHPNLPTPAPGAFDGGGPLLGLPTRSLRCQPGST
jgi:hypothetical protein